MNTKIKTTIIVCIAIAMPSAAFASESSSFKLYHELPNYADRTAKDSNNFKLNEDGLTWYQVPSFSNSFVLQAAQNEPDPAPPPTTTVTTQSSSTNTGGSGGGRRKKTLDDLIAKAQEKLNGDTPEIVQEDQPSSDSEPTSSSSSSASAPQIVEENEPLHAAPPPAKETVKPTVQLPASTIPLPPTKATYIEQGESKTKAGGSDIQEEFDFDEILGDLLHTHYSAPTKTVCCGQKRSEEFAIILLLLVVIFFMQLLNYIRTLAIDENQRKILEILEAKPTKKKTSTTTRKKKK